MCFHLQNLKMNILPTKLFLQIDKCICPNSNLLEEVVHLALLHRHSNIVSPHVVISALSLQQDKDVIGNLIGIICRLFYFYSFLHTIVNFTVFATFSLTTSLSIAFQKKSRSSVLWLFKATNANESQVIQGSVPTSPDI